MFLSVALDFRRSIYPPFCSLAKIFQHSLRSTQPNQIAARRPLAPKTEKPPKQSRARRLLDTKFLLSYHPIPRESSVGSSITAVGVSP